MTPQKLRRKHRSWWGRPAPADRAWERKVMALIDKSITGKTMQLVKAAMARDGKAWIFSTPSGGSVWYNQAVGRAKRTSNAKGWRMVDGEHERLWDYDGLKSAATQKPFACQFDEEEFDPQGMAAARRRRRLRVLRLGRLALARAIKSAAAVSAKGG